MVLVAVGDDEAFDLIDVLFRYVSIRDNQVDTRGMSSSGNASPQSTTMILSSYSKTVMFIPICSRP